MIIESIVNICNTMQYKTVAEWVSDEEKLALVKDIGIDYVQDS
ncbi:EAL domain-containing protein [Salinivibrio sp. YCSC6]|nr:EAL domain-containing protein [Salinivibrio sp. YCSC6]